MVFNSRWRRRTPALFRWASNFLSGLLIWWAVAFTALWLYSHLPGGVGGFVLGVAIALILFWLYCHPLYIFAALLYVGYLLACLLAWFKSPPIEGERGGLTIESLVTRYAEAHRRKDLNLMRPLLSWNRTHFIGDRSQDEAPIMRICEEPLARVEFVRHPDFNCPRGGEATYYIPAGQWGYSKSHCQAAGVFGKVILVLQNGRKLDPGFLVTKIDKLFYIDAQSWLANDVVNSLDAGAECNWVGAPLGSGNDILSKLMWMPRSNGP